MRQLVMVLAPVAAFCLPTAATAQNVYLLDGGAFSNALAANTLAERTRALIGAEVEAGPRKKSPPPSFAKKPATAKPATSLRFVPSPAASAISAIASRYPAARQNEVRSTLASLLPKFAAVEDMYGQPRHDLATAISAFIAMSYEAASGKEITQPQGTALIKQMRAVLVNEPGIAAAPAAEKQKLYEQFAIYSMLIAGAMFEVKQKPDAALAEKVKAAGRAYLAQLSLNPDKMRFTDQGLAQN